MTTEPLQSYNAVIKHTLEKAIQLAEQSPKDQTLNQRGIAGFCQLQGPTGGGKTSSLYRKSNADRIAPALELIKNFNRQAIFVTHRWNILHDIFHSIATAKDSQGQPLSVSIVYAQYENVVSAVTQTPLPHETGTNSSDLPDPFASIERLKNDELFTSENLEEKLKQTCSAIKYASRTINSKKPEIYHKYIAWEKEDLRKSCASLESSLLDNMSFLEQELEKVRKKFGNNSERVKLVQKRLNKFRSNSWIRRIFPAICWHDQQQHLLIMTTHKLFSSFYDGQHKVRISDNRLKDHVIFIDEFDYQADVLQKLLAQTQLVQEPPECIGQLLENGKRLLQRMQYVKSESVREINNRLKNFLDEIEQELKTKNIDLRSSRALVVPLKDYQENKTFSEQFLFRSDHLVTSQPLAMRRSKHGYEIEQRKVEDNETEEAVDVGSFLRLMEKFIRDFSLMISDISSTEEEARNYIKKLSKLLFDPANDYRPSYYSSTLPNLSSYFLPKANLVELRPLTKSNILPNTHAHVYGLTNWLLKQNTSEIDLDPLRIEIRRAFLPTTPEGLLLSLASRNLVFALSATSYIERAIGHFDTRWLTSALKYLAEARNPSITKSYLGTEFGDRKESWFKKPIPYVQSEADLDLQHNMIEQVSAEKASIRQTTLQVKVNEFDSTQQSHEGREMLASLTPDFFQQNEKPISDAVKKHRQKVLSQLLHVINLAGKNKHHQGQLAFVNSTKYLRKWLLEPQAQQNREFISWLQLDNDFSSILQNHSHQKTFDPKIFNDVFIPVVIHDAPAIICLLTAESQKRTGFSDAYQAAFDTNRIVLILTQTASATNGINLDFSLPDSKEQMDLTCLYLLEAQHFYFSPFEDSDDTGDEMSHAGFQLRNLDKLCRAGELSHYEHKKNILPLMTNSQKEISILNNRYKRSDDYIKNTAANVQQQVGRIERAWRKTPQVEIHLTSEIAKALSQFASMPTFSNNRRLISKLNIQLLEALLKRCKRAQGDFITDLMTPTQTGEKAVEIIDQQLVPAIRQSRESEKETDKLAQLWHYLGQAILKHDYGWNPNSSQYGLNIPLREWACCERPPESIPDRDIWYNPKTWQFFSSPGENRIRYYPEGLYEQIQRHDAILDWFNQRGYRTSIFPFANETEARYPFHPLVVQRLLQGRLGEEAIRALLNDRGIKTHTRLNHPSVLELYDFTVSDSDFRVDAKFWNQRSQDQADLEYQEWLGQGADPNQAPLDLINKLEQIRAAEGENIKLAVLNFVAMREDAQLLGFDNTLKPVTLVSQADILILGGCVTENADNISTPGFEEFIKLLFHNCNVNEKEEFDAIE